MAALSHSLKPAVVITALLFIQNIHPSIIVNFPSLGKYRIQRNVHSLSDILQIAIDWFLCYSCYVLKHFFGYFFVAKRAKSFASFGHVVLILVKFAVDLSFYRCLSVLQPFFKFAFNS